MIQLLFNKEIRVSWDKEVLEFTSLHDADYGDVYYMILKFPFPLKNRDFVERVYILKDDDGTDITVAQYIEEDVSN